MLPCTPRVLVRAMRRAAGARAAAQTARRVPRPGSSPPRAAAHTDEAGSSVSATTWRLNASGQFRRFAKRAARLVSTKPLVDTSSAAVRLRHHGANPRFAAGALHRALTPLVLLLQHTRLLRMASLLKSEPLSSDIGQHPEPLQLAQCGHVVQLSVRGLTLRHRSALVCSGQEASS